MAAHSEFNLVAQTKKQINKQATVGMSVTFLTYSQITVDIAPHIFHHSDAPANFTI
jgi:hypothetical protein